RFRIGTIRIEYSYRPGTRGGIHTAKVPRMLVCRRLFAVLTLGAPLLLVVPHSVVRENGQTSFSAAQAQSAATPGRIELYLPSARIAPPVPAPLAVRRAAPQPAPAPDPEEVLFGRLDRQAQHAA